MDRAAFDSMLVEHYEELTEWCCRLCGNRDDGEDLAHDTIIRAIESCADFEPTNPKAWLFTVAKHLFINLRRKEGRLPCGEIDDEAGGFGVESVKAAEEYIRMYDTLVDALPEPGRTTFRLREMGYKYQEIAAMQDIPLGTVKSRVFYAVGRIRKLIAGECLDD